MNRRRFGILAFAALIAIVTGWFVSTQRNRAGQTAAPALLPALANDVNAITAVTLRKGKDPAVTLHKIGTQWTVAERADYPADVVKLRKLLLSLRDARIVEEKTSDPARFAVLGVENPTDSAGAGAEVDLTSPNGNSGVIVGKSVGAGNYVRRSGENRSFSVEPAITLETEARYWIDGLLLDVPVALIQSIEFKPATGPAYTLHRLNPADASFSLEGAPPGRTPKDGTALAPPPSTFTSLQAEDVAQAKDIDFASSSQVILTLTDGRVMTLTGVAVGDKHWTQVKSNQDALSAKTGGRAFEIASYRYDAIFKPLEQLLAPLPPKPGPSKAASPEKPPPTQPAPAGSKAPHASSRSPHESSQTPHGSSAAPPGGPQ
jgi:hypothetical protein